MRNIEKRGSIRERFWLRVRKNLLLPALLLLSAFSVSASLLQTCDLASSYAASVLLADIRTPAGSQFQGYGSFELLRNGQKKIGVDLYPVLDGLLLGVSAIGVENRDVVPRARERSGKRVVRRADAAIAYRPDDVAGDEAHRGAACSGATGFTEGSQLPTPNLQLPNWKSAGLSLGIAPQHRGTEVTEDPQKHI